MGKVKLWIFNRLTRHLFGAITETEYVQINFTNREMTSAQVKVGGEFLEQSKVLQLANEARVLLRLPLWRVLTDDMLARANDDMLNKSQSMDDIFFGKAVRYSIIEMRKKIETLARIEN